MAHNNKIVAYTFSIFAISSAIVSFYLNINLSVIASYTGINEFLSEFNIFTKNGGAVSDLKTHWQYIQLLKKDINNLFLYELGVDFKLLNYPLHHIIISQIPFVNSNLKIYLLIFFIISLSLPVLFYKCLVIKYENISRGKLLVLASIIYILPGFQYSAIWGNSHITALFFLLYSIYFILKLEKSNFERSKYIYCSILFLALATYVKQFYVFLFPFYLSIIIKKKAIPIHKAIIFISALGLPGLIFLIKNPVLLFGLRLNDINITNFPSSILLSSSIIFIYLIPFIIQYFINNNITYKVLFLEISKKKNAILIITLVFFILYNYFYYESNIGGGIIYKISNIILDNNYIFLVSAYLGIFSILYYSGNNINNYFLSLLLLVTFSTGFFIFQKYFEPMFFILLLSFYDKKIIEKSIIPGINWIIFYFIAYYLALNIIY
ncbi:hypothetical protein OAN92_05270 [Candidatus Pelagibacter ubique]|nr:hypothetical protein [Candidatus Pelagibacter ubique]